jgi:hypothetical protein
MSAIYVPELTSGVRSSGIGDIRNIGPSSVPQDVIAPNNFIFWDLELTNIVPVWIHCDVEHCMSSSITVPPASRCSRQLTVAAHNLVQMGGLGNAREDEARGRQSTENASKPVGHLQEWLTGRDAQ